MGYSDRQFVALESLEIEVALYTLQASRKGVFHDLETKITSRTKGFLFIIGLLFYFFWYNDLKGQNQVP
jgi:hypothetical protein